MGIVVDFFENVLEQAAAFLSNVYDAIVEGVKWVVDEVVGVLSRVYAWISDHIVVVIAAVTVACVIFYPYIASYVAKIASAISKVWTSISAFVTTMKEYFTLFLKAIHFKTLLKLHEVLYFLSDSYRYYWQQLMYQFSEFSASIGFDAQTVALAIQNARVLVLDVSASMGMKYDLAEITWLKNLREYARMIEYRGESYARNPWQALDDIDQLLVRPAINVKAATSQVILAGIDGALEGVKGVVDDVVKIRDDLNRFVGNLPSGIREQVQEAIAPYINKFNEFISSTYGPAMSVLDGTINLINGRLELSRENIKAIIERIKNPANYLLEIDRLSDSERLNAERKISDIVFRPYNRDYSSNAPEYHTKLETLRSIAEALNRSTVNEQWYVSEMEKPVRPAFAPAIARNTWFVGDF